MRHEEIYNEMISLLDITYDNAVEEFEKLPEEHQTKQALHDSAAVHAQAVLAGLIGKRIAKLVADRTCERHGL